MKRTFIFTVILALGSALAAPAGAVGSVTTQTLPDGSTVYLSATGLWQGDEWTLENNIARGADGSVYIAGTFQEVSPSTRTRVFARRLSPAGAQVWTSTISNINVTAGYDYGRGIALNRFGNEVYVLGMQEYAGGRDLVVSRYAANTGLLLSSASYRDTGLDAYDIAVDTIGFVYAAGASQNQATLIRFNEALTSSTVVRAAAGSFGAAYAVAARGGRIALAGTVDAGHYGREIWLAGYDAGTLSQLWSNTYTPATADHPQWGADEARAVAIDEAGAIYAAGYYFSQTSGHDAWLGKYDSNGKLLYHKLKNGPSHGNDKAFGLALDSFGHVYVSGGLDASAQNRQQDLWVGKYSPAGKELGEVVLHRGYEAGYDVEVSTWMIYAGGGFGTDYGVVHISPGRFGAAQQLFAGPGPDPASARLGWVFPSAGSLTYKIQHSTYNVAWSTAQAQIAVSTNIAAANTPQSHDVRGLAARLDHTAAAPAPGPNHFFRVWINDSPLADGATAAAHIPVNNWTDSRIGQDEFRAFNNSCSPFSAAIRDADGGTVAIYPNVMGGAALTRFGADGRARWTSFYNSTGTNLRISVNRLAMDGEGNIYAAGAVSGMEAGADRDAWLAKFSPAGDKLWEGVIISTTGNDNFNAVAFDGAGNIYAGGSGARGGTTGDAMLLAKYSPAGIFISSAAVFNPGPSDRHAWINALVFAGPELYAGGYFSYANGAATNQEAALVRFDTALSATLTTNYTNVPLTGVNDSDVMHDLAFGGGRLYAAGAKARSSGTLVYPDFWVAAISTANWSQVWSSTYASVDTLPAEAFSLRLTSAAIYAAGYEERRDPMYLTVHGDVLLRKLELNGNPLWTKGVDGVMWNQNTVARGLELASDGYVSLAAVFDRNASGCAGTPGLARVKEPVPGLSARPGSRPSSVFLSWVADTELPNNTAVYVHHSTYTGVAFSTAAAQFSFSTARRQLSGELLDILVPALESGLGASGSPDSPVYYFKLGYMRPGDTAASVIPASAASTAATPPAAASAVRYANGELFLLNNARGGRNPLARDAQGNIYTAGAISPGGPGTEAAWVRKSDAAGRPVWTRFWYGSGHQPVINALALDGQGNLYAAGQFGYDAAFGDMPLIKYGPDGRMHWSRAYNLRGGVGAGNAAHGLAVNASGVYVAGYTTSMYTSPPNFPGFMLARIHADTGVVISSVVNSSIVGTFNDVKLDEDGNVFAVGYSSTGATGPDLLIARYSSALGPTAQLQLNNPGHDEAYALALDTAAAGSPLLYVAGEMTLNGQRDATLNKFISSATITGLWTSTVVYNSAGVNADKALGLALDGQGVYVSGEEHRYDIGQGKNLFVRKYTGDGGLLWSQTVNSGSDNDDQAGGIAVDTAGGVYAALAARRIGATAAPDGAGCFKYAQPAITAMPRLTVRVSSGTAAGNVLPGVNVAVMGFSQTGGIDPNVILLGTTGPSGAITLPLPGGRRYFVAISSHNMVPTVNEQLSAPGGNFFLTLNADTTRQYYISPRSTAAVAAHTMRLNVSTHTGNMAPGDHLMGEVFITRTGERVAYGFTRATAAWNSLDIYNLPAAAAGAYGMAVSVPARNSVLQLFANNAFPSISAYTADMSKAARLTGSFDVGTSTMPPSVAGTVLDNNRAPLSGARVRLQRYDCAGTMSCALMYDSETFSDAGGGFSFYHVPFSTHSYNLSAGKAGYERGWHSFPLPDGAPLPYIGTATNPTTFSLGLATYTLTGILNYNGSPLPNAVIMVHPDWRGYSYENPASSDSYRWGQWGGIGIRSDARVRTGADGRFTVEGLTDGNASIEAVFEGGWRSFNDGKNTATQSDDLRVVISSQGARGPGAPAGNACRPGRTWIVNSSGTCVTAGAVPFNIVPDGGNTGGRLHGSLKFVTTYTVTAVAPLVISTSSPLTIMAQEMCDKNCGDQQMGFTTLAGAFISNTTGYSIALSSGINYYPRILSGSWAAASSFHSGINLTSTDTFRYDISVVRSGGLKGVVKMPDGSNFKPRWGDCQDCYWADISAEGVNVDVGDGKHVDENGEFEFPNLAPGVYSLSIRPGGRGFVWAPAKQEVVVAEGRVTGVKLQLEAGLAVKPEVLGLPEISTPTWRYRVVGVESGTEMNRETLTELLFSKDGQWYVFEYSTSTGWGMMYMPPGQYDFYLLLAARYEPESGGQSSYRQFANFIGRARGVAVQKSDSNPNLGTAAQPIAVNILGSLGQAGLAGTVKGKKLFTDADLDRIFASINAIFPLLPAVMLYDSAGELRGFSHAMPPSSSTFAVFMSTLAAQDKPGVRSFVDNNQFGYGVWGLPPGRYTAVFANPNYPPSAREILDITAPGPDIAAFDFDAQKTPAAGISGVVRSSATGAFLAGAEVFLKHRTMEKFALTDSSGAFSFSSLPVGIYRIEVIKDGHVTAGAKIGAAAGDSKNLTFHMLPSEFGIGGRVFVSGFPTQAVKAGVAVAAYDETENVNNPAAYLPVTLAHTDASGNFEINGVAPGHLYKLSVFHQGKLPEVLEVRVSTQGHMTTVGDIILKDVPPQIMVKVRKSADSVNKVEVTIKSPRRLMTAPSCRYNSGQSFDPASAVALTLAPGPGNTYLGQFTAGGGARYYTVKVTAGDAGYVMEKEFVYDQVSSAKTEQYIQQESLAGGAVQMDTETEEYSGIELDPGALSYSTATSETVDYSNLIGGFFSSLPSVRTVRTDKGDLTISAAIQSLMASEVYNLDLSNASANKPFTLTLKYDKERGAAHTGTMRIYQQDAAGNWREVPGDYTVDPMLGVLSVDVAGLSGAAQGAAAASTPLGRKQLGMSAVVAGRYVPAATSAPQSGRFAVMTSPPAQGVAAWSAAFEIFNMPNPFDLKAKSVALSGDTGASGISNPYSTKGTVLKFNLPAGKGGNVKFVIYNLAGEKVRTLDMGSLAGGRIYYSEWDGRNDKNGECASGVYFLLPFVNGEKLTGKAHKMAIVK